eukprot:jgi/Chrzof1/14529/Cz09g06060.t1
METSQGFSGPVYGFSDLWLNTQFADVELTVSETSDEQSKNLPPEPAAKRPRRSDHTITIPAHRVLIAKGSEYFKTQLDTAVGAGTNGSNVTCSLQVEKGELKVAKAVIQSLYM